MKLHVSNATLAARGCVPKSSDCVKASAPTKLAPAGRRQPSLIPFLISAQIAAFRLPDVVWIDHHDRNLVVGELVVISSFFQAFSKRRQARYHMG
jgi:hypothetical protein